MEPIFDKLFQFTYNQGWRYSRCGTGMQLERPGGCYPRELPEHGAPTAKDNRCIAAINPKFVAVGHGPCFICR